MHLAQKNLMQIQALDIWETVAGCNRGQNMDKGIDVGMMEVQE